MSTIAFPKLWSLWRARLFALADSLHDPRRCCAAQHRFGFLRFFLRPSASTTFTFHFPTEIPVVWLLTSGQ